MTKQEQLKQWLGNRQRKYADGVAIFKGLGRKVQLAKYEAYFDAAPASPSLFDPHFTQLINILARMEREMTVEPSLYPEATVQVVAVKILDAAETNDEVKKRAESIAQHEEQIESLKNEMLSIIDDNADNSDQRTDEIQEQIDQHEAELQQLRKEVEELQKPGIKVVTEASMPSSIKKAYARIKEITPLYASLHNDIADEKKSDEERKPLAEELCKLDDERRKLWKLIDVWSEGKGTLSLDEKRPEYSDNPIVRGVEFARAVKRLKQNIRNSQLAADKAKADGRQVVYDNAMQRIAGYEAELAEIETEIAGETTA